jgi:N6-L-threonylcarbamoyladenine synthase
MLILGIESSCDDTAAAVVEDGRRVVSTVVASQDDVHNRYGGIVPELASRRHIEAVIPVVEEALARASARLGDMQGIAVTRGPGLVGSILVGLSFAKAVSYVGSIPLVPVNHIEAHPMAAFLDQGAVGAHPAFPFVALVVSGGHTELMLFRGFTDYSVLGSTLDDAAGEAFDKAAKLMGLGYPGGAAIDRLSRTGDPGYVRFTRPYISRGSLDFSFSGIKTALLTVIKGLKKAPSEEEIRDISASFQEAIVDVLVAKCLWALDATGGRDLVVSGGVACNSRLRARLKETAASEGFRLFIPPPNLCSDNGATIAALGFHLLSRGVSAGLGLNAVPSLEDI